MPSFKVSQVEPETSRFRILLSTPLRGQRDGFVSGFRGNRNDIAGQNIAFDLQILAVFVVDGRSHCHHFLRNVAGQCLNSQRESGFIAIIGNGKQVAVRVHTQRKRSIALRKGKVKCSDHTAVVGIKNIPAVPVNIRTENGDLPADLLLEMLTTSQVSTYPSA